MVRINKGLKRIRLGKIQKKILLLLQGGVALSLAGGRGLGKQIEILDEICDEWKNFDQKILKQSIKKLYESKVIKEKKNKDGTVTIVLSEEGRRKALTYHIDNLEIAKPKKWDKKWRFVLFDVPERKKPMRNALRFHLKAIGFYEFQKSVFVHPYNCKDIIDYIIEIYEVREFVRFVVAESVDNELHLRSYFNLISKNK